MSYIKGFPAQVFRAAKHREPASEGAVSGLWREGDEGQALRRGQ